ncbi:hypothetical protein JXQ70_06075 [bacterium]|nr:hypothetical protein [bacterium]
MVSFEQTLYETLHEQCEQVLAWCVLSNHYHALIKTEDLIAVIKEIGLMHGRLAYQWNGEDEKRGRKCWHRCQDRVMRSNRHRWVSVNYIHHNPIHHGYVSKWQDWPFSSAHQYLEQTDPKIVKKMWETYPLWDYGKGWDDPEL